MSESKNLKDEVLRAEQLNIMGNYSSAIEIVTQVMQKIHHISSNSTMSMVDIEEVRIRVLLVISFAEAMQGTFEQALLNAQKAYAHSTAHNLEKSTANSLCMIGRVYYHRGSYDAALEFYGKALAMYNDLEDTLSIAKVRKDIGDVYYMLGSYSKALECYTELLATFKEQDQKTMLAYTLSGIGNVYFLTGQLENALKYYKESLAIFQGEGNTIHEAYVIGCIGLVYLQLVLFGEAFEFLTKALELNEKLGAKLPQARVRGYIGSLYMQLADYKKSLEYYAASLEILSHADKASSVPILDSIGSVYKALQDNTLSLEYHHKALALSIELGTKGSQAIVLGNLGNAYMAIGDYDTAYEYLQGALELSLELGTLRPAGYWMHGIANLEYKRGNIEKAEEGVLQTLHHRRQVLKTKEGVASALYDMAEIKYAQSKLDEALDFYNQALALAKETGERDVESAVYWGISNIYTVQGDPTRALDYYKHYHALEKEVQSEEATKQGQLLEHRRKIEESERDRQIKLARFQEQEKILHNILPAQIAERMVQGETTIAESYQQVSVFFSDIVSFTELSQSVTAEELVALLNGIFSQFDQLTRKHGLEKIKTIGDAYMAVAGAPVRVEDHAARAASFAVDVANFMEHYHTPSGEKIGLRIGLHTGSVVAGIIGENKFAYDLWGDAVNTASRMESHGEAGKIHVSEEFMQALKTAIAGGTGRDLSLQPHSSLSSLQSLLSFSFQERGELDIKGKGIMKTYFLEKA